MEDSTVPAASMPAIIGNRRTTGDRCRDREAVLVVHRRPFRPHHDIAVHQIVFVEIGERDGLAGRAPVDHDRLECRHEGSPFEAAPRRCKRF